MVVVPKGADQFVKGRICAATGSAKVLWPDQAQRKPWPPKWIGSCRPHSQPAARISSEMAAMPILDVVPCDRRTSDRQLSKTKEHEFRILSHRQSCEGGFMLNELQDT